MLRASSSAFGYDVNVDALVDPSIPTGVPGGTLLLRLVDAVLTESEALDGIHGEIIGELGPEALVDAASVFGNFEMMNRVAEVSGIPIPQQGIDRNRDLIERLDMERFIKH
ncbi:MAG: hypothetical protein QNJ71_11385 [Acidimicrobiia bacterium]|nr:hypothetical protein [Acidimicrobiia bacterium]